MQQREQRVVVITGASSGFGLLAAGAFAREGWRVYATMRDLSKQERLAKLAALLPDKAGAISCLRLDVTDPVSIEEAIYEVIEQCGKIDVLINNAGFATGGYTEEISLDVWRSQLETNFFGMVSVTKAVLPHMRERGQGKIINVSSVSGRMAIPGYAPYAASKFAMEGFSEALRLEMLPYGVHVVLVEPGPYRTDIWDKGFAHIAATPGSPYANRLQAVLDYSRQSANNAQNPQEVAELMVRIAQLRKPRLRYPVGKGASLLVHAKSWLPWSWIEKLVLRALEKRL